MRFFALAVTALATCVAAQNPNPFTWNSPTFVAGQATKLTWSVTAGSTVTLQLQWGSNPTQVPASQGITIASGITNDGSYSWTPSADIPVESDYFIRITDDQDPTQANYSPTFTISGVSGSSTITTPSSTASSTSSTSSTSTTIVTTTSSTSSSSAVSTTTSSSAVPTTTTTTVTTSSSTSAAASTTTKPPNTGGAAAVKVPVAMMGVALGAFALL